MIDLIVRGGPYAVVLSLLALVVVGLIIKKGVAWFGFRCRLRSLTEA